MSKRFFYTLTPLCILAVLPGESYALNYGATAVSQTPPAAMPAMVKKTPPPLPPQADHKSYDLVPVSRQTGKPLEYERDRPPLTSYKPKENSIPPEYRVSVSAGYSASSLNWNIGLPDDHIDILSELTWRNLRSYVVAANGEYECRSGWCNGIMLFGTVYGDKAFHGDNQDSDFFGDGRSSEFSRSNNNADGSRFAGYSVGIGYDLGMEYQDIAFGIIPKVGYSYDTQKLHIGDGYQTIPATGAFPGLDSRYETQWEGPYAGLEARVLLFNRHEFRGGWMLTKADYNAGATWNLRNEFQQPTSYEHNADGLGRTFTLGYSFWITPEWELRLDSKYEFWKAGPGTYTTYFIDNSSLETRFNEVRFKAYTYTAGLGYRF